MSDTTTTEPATTATDPTTATTTEPAATTTTEPAKVEVWQDPDKARAEIERLRRENGSARTTAKQQAADEARAELAQTIGKALGIVKDDKTPVDPAEITKQLADAQAAQRVTAVELAVYRTATDHGGDPNALLDSRTLYEEVARLSGPDGGYKSWHHKPAFYAVPGMGGYMVVPR